MSYFFIFSLYIYVLICTDTFIMYLYAVNVGEGCANGQIRPRTGPSKREVKSIEICSVKLSKVMS